MEHMTRYETVKDLTGALGGLIGTGLGLYNLWRGHAREEAAKRTEEADWQRWVEFIAEQGGSPARLAYRPAPGSDDHKWAERMVAKGMLHREIMGGTVYTLRE
jgi:hypothetical protein